MACTDVQQNNVGTVFRVTFVDCDAVAIDISTATTKEIIFKDSAGTRTAKAGAFTTDGINGQLDYTSEASFLAEPGEWSVQGHVVIGTQDFYTEVDSFTVIENL